MLGRRLRLDHPRRGTGPQLQAFCPDCYRPGGRGQDSRCHDCAALVRARRVVCLAQRASDEVGLFHAPPVEVEHAERIMQVPRKIRCPTSLTHQRRIRLARYLLTGNPIRACEITRLLGCPKKSAACIVQRSPWFASDGEKKPRWSLTPEGRAAMQATVAG